MKKNKWLMIFLPPTILVAVLRLLMFFNREMSWGLGDFIIAWFLFFGASYIYQLTTSSNNLKYKIATFIAVITSLFLVWINLAVGIIGNENNPANLFYFVVVFIFLAGFFIFQDKALKLSRVLVITSIAQFLVPILAIIIWRPEINIGVFKVMVFNFIFVVSWLVSAFLFYKSIIKNKD